MRPLGVVVAVPLLASVLAGCGTETGDQPTAEGEWSKQTLSGEQGADSPVGLATSGDDVMVSLVDDSGTVLTHLSRDGERFAAGEPFATETRYVRFADPVRHDGQWLLVGSGGLSEEGKDEKLLFEPVVLRSEDGLRWEREDVTGFSAPMEVSDVVSVDGRLVAAGTYRLNKDPSMGGFRATVWRSEDGTTWTEAELPGAGAGRQSYVTDVAVSGGNLLAVGAAEEQGQLWVSDDSGASWRESEQSPLRETYSLTAIAATSESVVVSGQDGERPSVFRSTDRGATWTPITDPYLTGEREAYAPMWSAGNRFLTVTESSPDPFGPPGPCYADIEQCASTDVATTFWASDDGVSWSPVEVPAAGGQLVGVVGQQRRVLVAEVVSGGVAVHSWPAAVDLPQGTEPAPPETVEVVQVPENGSPEVGVRYHAPLYVHCGMDWLYLGDTVWQRSDGGPDVETGAGEGWPIAGQTIYGYATLTENGIVEYSIGEEPDDEVIATYESAREGVGCD